MVSSSPCSAPFFGAKHEIYQWVRRLATRLPSKRKPRAVLRPCRLRMPAMMVSGVLGQPAHERDSVRVGAHRGLALHR
jgi:hypothetical protein